MAKLIKISSIVYSVMTMLFFMLASLGARFIGAAQEEANAAGTEIVLSGGKLACIVAVNILLYIELFGYFAILFEVLLYFLKKNRMTKMRQIWPESEKFPALPFFAGLLFFLLFMSLMRAIL